MPGGGVTEVNDGGVLMYRQATYRRPLDEPVGGPAALGEPVSPAKTTPLVGDLGVTQQDGVRVHHPIQNLKFNSQFNTHELFISGIFHSKFIELGLLQVTETSESRAVDKGVTGLSILCPKLFLRHQGTRRNRENHSLRNSGRGCVHPNLGHWLCRCPPGSHGL